MAIIIKGMEMPENCFDCPCMRHDSIDGMSAYQCNVMLRDGTGDGRPEWCPLVEVPKHGRLIDADALMSTIKEHDYLLYDRLTDTTKPGMFTFGIEYAVCTAPTIEIIHCKDCPNCGVDMMEN